MSYPKVSWLKPAAGLLVVLAVAALWLMGANTTEAGNGGSVVITPASAQVGAGGTTTVNVDVTAPAGGLSVWIVEIGYDPAVVQVDTINSDPNCQSQDIPNSAGQGTLVQANGCAVKGTPANTAVALGAWVKNVGGSATGWDGTHTIASFTFKAVGTAGQSSPLTITVGPNNFLLPDGTPATPTTTNGLITITAGTTRIFGDADCSGAVDIGDAINIQRKIASLSVNKGAGCPDIGANVMINGVQRAWGDVDCSGAVDIGDAINEQRSIASLSVNKGAGCPTIGDNVTVS